LDNNTAKIIQVGGDFKLYINSKYIATFPSKEDAENNKLLMLEGVKNGCK
tara:strand:+ start:6163 stop:6312 length:150 start_codon:yes stop_codon:yes gene_type:complete